MDPVTQSIDIAVPPARVYALIVDFARYPGFVPNQTAVEVIEADPAAHRWQARFELSVARRLRYTLDLRGEPERGLTWDLVEGDGMKQNTGGWTLEPLDGGKRTRATYRLAIELDLFVPRTVTKALIERTLPATLEAFRDEAERREH